ncbi:MAG: hypothetical protein RL710_2135, partial [Pseudomonadota bacterium]
KTRFGGFFAQDQVLAQDQVANS